MCSGPSFADRHKAASVPAQTALPSGWVAWLHHPDGWDLADFPKRMQTGCALLMTLTRRARVAASLLDEIGTIYSCSGRGQW